jgi:hypothetical protein
LPAQAAPAQLHQPASIDHRRGNAVLMTARDQKSQRCANMGCQRYFEPLAGKHYCSKRCARQATERRREREYRELMGAKRG